MTPDQQHCLDENNRIRAAAGRAEHKPDERLMNAAQTHAEHMAATRRLTHAGLEARVSAVGFRWSAVAENIAQGQSDAGEVFSDWMTSAGHKANILGHTEAVGFGRSGDYWCAIYATEAGSGQPPVGPPLGRRRWLDWLWTMWRR